jgi:2-oxoglutarate ferredoxin oxidoreductase subunit alpha
MTTTSGGGFCLMVEALGLAGMTEVPIVVVDAQRGGPSTGLPTRTEQSDLLFVINAGHGEFPRIVLAPRTTEECFETGWRAFNLADRYQCPVIILTDTLMATTLRTVEPDAIDFTQVDIDRGQTVEAGELAVTDGYRRYEFSDDGVSPRAVPGTPQAVYSISSDEHDEAGHITEDAENRVRMMQKRMRKLETAKREMRAPTLYGPEDAEITLACWGSTYGACREAVDRLNAYRPRANLISFADVWPLPERRVAEALRWSHKLIVVEGNYTSELAQLLRLATGIVPDATINRYDGRPFTPEYILRGVEEETLVGTGR